MSQISTPPLAFIPGPSGGPSKIVIQIDPTWPYIANWQSPTGLSYLEVENFSYEDGIQEGQGVLYDHEQVTGRAEPYLTYQGTDALIYTIPFVLHADGDNGETNIAVVINNEVIGPLNFLNSLKQPFRLGTAGGRKTSHAPPPVLVTMGSYFQARGVVTDFSGHAREVFDSLSLRPHRIDCSLTLQVVRSSISDFYPVDRRFV